MKNFYPKIALTWLSLLSLSVAMAQTCPTSGNHNQSGNENTYYPGATANLSAGSTSIALGAAGTGTNFGTTPIASGDFVLIIQMQGAMINVPSSATASGYGNGAGTGSGNTTTNFIAGYMEFATAASAVGTGGGTLTITSGLTYSYQSAAATATAGQYTYQVIRVPTFYNITLTGTVTAPAWNGSVGGVTVINAANILTLGGQTVTAAGAGFRGGGSRSMYGSSSVNKNAYYYLSSYATGGGKGEGIAGTPQYINSGNYSSLLNTGIEGYPSGSSGRGAPGNAGGGANDVDPPANDQNAGGGGGGNGGQGGSGGWGWYSAGATGGKGGQTFSTATPSPITYTYYFSPSRLIMGGGGGGGTTNNGTGSPGSGLASSGAAGGGLVILNATAFSGSGTVDVSGAAGNSTPQIDASGGGGAAGSVLIYANSGQSGITVNAAGGVGGSNSPGPAGGATQHGPGGGGGGGVVYSNAAINSSSSVLGGAAGISYGTNASDSYGAVAGSVGLITTSYPASQLPPNMTQCQATLPLNLLSFTASYQTNNTTLVSWKTNYDAMVNHYEVERSTDDRNFVSAGSVAAQESTEPVLSYSFTDTQVPDADKVYYRLKVVDQTGRVSYSQIVVVKTAQSAQQVSIYPNPVDNYTYVSIHTDKAASGLVRLIDNTGKQILTRSVTVTAGNNNIVVDQLGGLPRGVYFLQVFVGDNLYNQKLLKK